MKIENNYQQQTFKQSYIDMRSLNSIYQNKPIIRALKEQNTPLRKFIQEVINTEKFEKDMGDCFIKFSHERYPVEGLLFEDVDILQFSFPKKIEQARKKMHDKTEQMKPNPRYSEFANNAVKSQAKKMIPIHAEKEGSFSVIFDDGSCCFDSDYPNPTHKELSNYIKGSKIVEDLKKRIENISNNI